MRNAKKTLSLVMVAIFTTFIVLSGIPAGAVTSAAAKTQVTKATAAVVKVEKTVKVTTFVPATAQAQLTVATKEVAKVNKLGKTYKTTYLKLVARYQAVSKKITARKLAIANLAKTKMFTDADKAVTAAEKATNPDEVDLVADAAALATAQGAITNALELIVKLDKNSANYKGLMARVDAANGLIVKAMEDITAAEEAAKIAADAKAKLEAAIAAAETAVKAVEAAPLATAADLAAALELGKTAATAVTAVTDADAAAAFAARLKVVADKGLALQAKLAADAKALEPATIVAVSAVDGTITVTFDKKPLTTVAAVDFTITKTVTTAGAVTTTVVPTAVTVVSDTAITFTVPVVVASSTDQSVAYSVQYTTGTAMAVKVPYTVAKYPVLTVASATATSLKSVLVTFSTTVNETTAETVANYVVKDTTNTKTLTISSATLQADGKSVILAIKNATDDTLDHFQTNQASGSVAVSNVKDMYGNAITASTTVTLTAFDSAIPTITEAKFTAPKVITLTFSEPIETSGTVTFDNGTYYVNVPAAAAGGVTTLDLTLGTAVAVGAHTLVASGFYDYAGFKSASQTFALTYAADATVPTATISSINQTSVEIAFSKSMTMLGALNTDFAVYHTFNGQSAYKGTAVWEDDQTLLVTFSTPIPAGAVNIYLVNSTSSSLWLQDGWSNKFASVTLTSAVTADTTAPTITSVTKYDSTHLDVKMSETVNGVTAGLFTLKGASAGTVTVTGATLADSTNHIYRLSTGSTLNGDTYTLTVAGSAIYDTALVANYLAATTNTIVVSDTEAPVISDAGLANAADGTATKIKISFSKVMATTGTGSILDLNNYIWMVDGTTATDFPANTTIAATDGNKAVVITFPTGYTLAGDHVYVARMADALANVTTTFQTDVTVGNATLVAANFFAPATASTTSVTVECKQPLSSIDASRITVDGKAVVAASYVNQLLSDEVTNGALVTLTVASTDAWTTGDVPTVVFLAPAVVNSVTHKALTTTFGTANAADINTLVTDDGVAPALSTAKVTGPQEITLTYTEALNPTTVGLYTYTVAGNTISSIDYTAGTTTVVLSLGTALVGTNATASVTQALGIKDLAGNTKTSSTTAFTAADGQAPAAPTATINSTKKIVTLTFAEALKASTVVAGSFTCTVANSATATVSYTAGSTVVTLTFSDVLADNDTIVVKTDVQDAAGNALAAPKTLTVKTTATVIE